MAKPLKKQEDPASMGMREVKDDPYAELFADCHTTEDVMQLQAEIDAMEARRASK